MNKSPIPYEWNELYKKDILITEKEIWDSNKILENGVFLNQVELLIWTYKNKGHRNNQMILQVGQPTDMLLQDPPCLRHIDTRIQDDKLHFYPYFRSWDLWGGFPANLAGIQMMKEYIAAEIGVGDGEMIASSKGLHLYDYSFDLVKCLRMRDDIQLKEGKIVF
jgi:thymidylate synthase